MAINEKQLKRLNVQDEPMVVYCAREQLKKGIRYGPVIREVFIIECNISGHGAVVINGRNFPFGPRSCYVLFPGDTVTHISDHADPRGGIYCAVYGLNLARHFKEAGITSETPFAPPEIFDEMRQWIEQMLEDLDKKDAGAPMRQASRIYGLLGTLLKSKTAVKREDWVKKAIGLMETNYPDPLNVASLAQEVGLERTYFSSLFKEKTGLSPYQYLTSLRIEKACLLLEDNSNSVAQVAELVGLDPRNFSRLFKKEIGKTPLEYKNRNKEG